MVKFALFIVKLFKVPVKWLGVDYPQFEILIRTKLTIDFRSTPTGFQTSGSKKRTLLYQLLTYSLFGLLFGIAAFSVGDLVLSLTIFFAVIMVSLTMTLISEFTTVLFDQRDNNILLPRPISQRTLLLLRLVHIQFYMGFIALALSIPTAIILAVKFKLITVFIYFIAVGLSTWMTLIFTTFIYLMISKIVNGERFKDLITYAQIVIAIIIFGSYQLIPRLMDAAVLKNISISDDWWTYICPPVWFAALVKLSSFTLFTTHLLLLSILAVVVPVTGAAFLIRSMSRGFGNILGEGSSESIKPQGRRTPDFKLTTRINKFFCISEIEKAGWNFTMATTRRDRKFKQSVYPLFGMMIVFAVVILKPDLTNLGASLQEKGELSKYFFIAICGFSGSSAVLQLPYTDTPDAAWIYKALPLKEHGHLLTGSVKALLFKFFVPIYLLITIPSILLWGSAFLPQIVLIGLGNILLTLTAIVIQKMVLPFTRLREMQQKGTNSIIAILSMILMFMVGGFAYLTSFLSGWITFLICGSAAGLIVLMFRFIRKKTYCISG